MRLLVVGDAHIKIGIINESRSFFDQLLDAIRDKKPDAVVLLGDQFDTFAVVRSEVLSLWTRFFSEASKISHIIALVGNHDLSGADGGTNPMEAFRSYPNVSIVEQYSELFGMHFLPYFREASEFEAACRKVPKGSTLFCHQSFNGAVFENGFFDPHGADPRCVEHLGKVISGHIHKAQTIGNIWYPGTPFQHSFADAGEKKAVHLLDGDAVVETIELQMPQFGVISAGSIEELGNMVSQVLLRDGTENLHLKIVAPGTPSEIATFWASAEAATLKKRVKRLVDGLTSVKVGTAFSQVRGATLQERLNEFVTTRTWRTDPRKLADRAARLLWA